MTKLQSFRQTTGIKSVGVRGVLLFAKHQIKWLQPREAGMIQERSSWIHDIRDFRCRQLHYLKHRLVFIKYLDLHVQPNLSFLHLSANTHYYYNILFLSSCVTSFACPIRITIVSTCLKHNFRLLLLITRGDNERILNNHRNYIHSCRFTIIHITIVHNDEPYTEIKFFKFSTISNCYKSIVFALLSIGRYFRRTHCN